VAGPYGARMVSPAVRKCHTEELSAAELRELRGLMDVSYDGEFTDDDWRHGLGGTHALVKVDGELVAAGALVRRRLRHDGRNLRCGYVEGVATHPDHRRLGHASAVMKTLEALAGTYDLLALSSSEAGFELYESRGWDLWGGHTSVQSPSGVVATPGDDGSVFVFAADVPLDLDGELTCDWREGDVW
jgi:aminoglycoside 2'-N-acetyltransferase I